MTPVSVKISNGPDSTQTFSLLVFFFPFDVFLFFSQLGEGLNSSTLVWSQKPKQTFFFFLNLAKSLIAGTSAILEVGTISYFKDEKTLVI